MKIIIPLLITLSLVQTAHAQFAPQAGVAGSTAVSKNSGAFTGWADGCSIQRGYLDINDKQLGYVNAGDSSAGKGVADNLVVSLGDSGMAVLSFSHTIYNGPGPDFAVFENGFPDPSDPEMAFLEFAFVEVSSDGINYFRFPPISNTPQSPQIPVAGVYMNARLVNNLAGKYIASYGTPFDLQELDGTPGLDINNITHIRLVDVVGSTGSGGSMDMDGNKINDPYPSPIPSGGFDLDAVGAFYQHGLFPVKVKEAVNEQPLIYPNPVTDRLTVSLPSTAFTVTLTDIAGRVLQRFTAEDHKAEIQLSSYRQGIYYILLRDMKGDQWVEKITRL